MTGVEGSSGGRLKALLEVKTQASLATGAVQAWYLRPNEQDNGFR
jgi:hypothetical protein